VDTTLHCDYNRTEFHLCVATFSACVRTAELRLPMLKVLQWCRVYHLLSLTVLTDNHIFSANQSPVFSNLDSSRGAHCLAKMNVYTNFAESNIQGNQKVSVHLMITIQKVASNVQNVPHQAPDIYCH
jgi:hypothetical protein